MIGRDDGSSGWRRVRQLGALVAAGAGRLRQLGLGDGLKAWAAQVRQQATGRHASRQAGSVRAGRLCAVGADWAMWLGAAELGLRPWWSGDGVRTGKSR